MLCSGVDLFAPYKHSLLSRRGMVFIMCMYLAENNKPIRSLSWAELKGFALLLIESGVRTDLSGLCELGPLQTTSFLHYFYCFWEKGAVLLSNKSRRQSLNAPEHEALSHLLKINWNHKQYKQLRSVKYATRWPITLPKVIIPNSVANYFNFMPLIWNWWEMDYKVDSWRVTDYSPDICQMNKLAT